MKRILPISRSPLSSYPQTANIGAFLWNDPRVYPWLLNYFIKLFGWDMESIDYEDFFLIDCPEIEYERIGRKTIINKWRNYLSFIRDMIEEGYYVYLCVKMEEICGYKDKKGPHDMMIYGYDDRMTLFYAADFFENRYDTKTVQYDEMEKALMYL